MQMLSPALQRILALRWNGLTQLRALGTAQLQHGQAAITAPADGACMVQPTCVPASADAQTDTDTSTASARGPISIATQQSSSSRMPTTRAWALGGLSAPASHARMQYSSSHMRQYSSDSSTPPPGSGPPPAGDGKPSELRMSLQDALMKLVDAAVEMVEQGHTDDAIAVLKEGIATFEPNFPDSPEIGELHNQVALLSLVSGDADSAVVHASTALDITKKHFATSGPLVGHRSLRLGVANFAQGKLTEAAGLLHGAVEALTVANDPSRFEGRYYLVLSLLAGTRDVAQVAQVEERLLSDIKEMKAAFGAESMILSLALAQHDRIAHQPLAAAEPDPLLCEALLKQHTRLLESVLSEGEDLAVAHYKLATFYYVHDMLQEAQGYVRRAGSGLRAVLPEDHPLVSMCKHRLGMICAVLGDHRAATQLLEASNKQYGGSTESGTAMSGLAREAQLGLAIAKYRGLPQGTDAKTKAAALDVIRARLDELAAAIGINHMLVRGAMKHVAQMNVKAFK